ncbi:MAG: ABC transporter substrate-binding protein [Acidocella sp.]|nr:ABC transporter substrate-binding protein [Acidocella sp.]
MITRRIRTICAALTVVAPLAITPLGARAADSGAFPLAIAQQPQRWALEWYIATKEGWWKDVGIDPTMTTFTAGPPEIAAGASGSWEVGGAGDLPSMLGAAKYGLTTIAIADSEAAIITLMATKDKADAYLHNPSLIKGKTIPETSNSTGEWGAAACLEKKFGLKPSEYHFVNLSPPEINAAVSSGRYDLAQVWSPNVYILESAIGAKVICNAAQVGVPITSNIFATQAFATAHPEIVAKFLAVYLRAIAWEREHPQEAVADLGEFFNSVGVKIPPAYLAQELHARPAYTLDEQLKIFGANTAGTPEIVDWWNQLGTFMQSVSIVSETPPASQFATDKYLQMIAADPKLRAFANDDTP